jgi:hypothetical protein
MILGLQPPKMSCMTALLKAGRPPDTGAMFLEALQNFWKWHRARGAKC